MSLTVAPCSLEAAKYAVLRWHYSEAMPVGKLARYGVWEDGAFIGAILFGRGASPYLGTKLRLPQTECCELVRVALKAHNAPVTQAVAGALRLLKRDSPGLRVVISFADPDKGHIGTIYQAGNWFYLGRSGSNTDARINGRWVHSRQYNQLSKAERQALVIRSRAPKHRYAYPLDRAMRRRLLPASLPYPLAEEGSMVSRQPSGLEGQVQSLHSAPN